MYNMMQNYIGDINHYIHTTGFALYMHLLKFMAMTHLSVPSEKIVNNHV